MIALAKVKEVERLLVGGKMSHRKIAKATGVSRATVGAIASVKRADYEARHLERAKEREPLGPLERCAECGGMVYKPCRLCRARKAKSQQEEIARAARRRAREQARDRLLAAIRRAHQPPAAP
jgi:hypothetical protein